MPPAEVAVDAELVRLLLREQFPDLAPRSLTVLANGWDNVVLRLGDDLLVRLPRREAAARLVTHEHRWLPGLAPLLPLSVPVPLQFGRPGPAYPWPWTITRYLPGAVVGDAQQLDMDHAARSLGLFLARRQRPAPRGAPVNALRGVPLRRRDEGFWASLPMVGDVIDSGRAQAIWRGVLTADPWQHPPVWLHGDLHPANLLVENSRIVAVIDFGDITSGDPATDLAIAWMLFGRRDRQVFWSTYARHACHPLDSALQSRSLGWALALGMVFVAHSGDNPMIRNIGMRTLAAVLGETAVRRPTAGTLTRSADASTGQYQTDRST